MCKYCVNSKDYISDKNIFTELLGCIKTNNNNSSKQELQQPYVYKQRRVRVAKLLKHCRKKREHKLFYKRR